MIKNGFNDYSELIESCREKFETYYKLLTEYNGKFNITAITEKNEVYSKHFEDSLLGADFIDKGTLIDVGSGGGFPAIPLKIVNDDLNVTLLDATEKKCFFMETVVRELGLKNVKVIYGRAEEICKGKMRESFDYCTSRAVGRLNGLAEYTLPFLKIGGKFVCYKSGNAAEEITEAENAVKILGGEITEITTIERSYGTRKIVEIKKIKRTPTEYPRSFGKIKKYPLK